MDWWMDEWVDGWINRHTADSRMMSWKWVVTHLSYISAWFMEVLSNNTTPELVMHFGQVLQHCREISQSLFELKEAFVFVNTVYVLCVDEHIRMCFVLVFQLSWWCTLSGCCATVRGSTSPCLSWRMNSRRWAMNTTGSARSSRKT